MPSMSGIISLVGSKLPNDGTPDVILRYYDNRFFIEIDYNEQRFEIEEKRLKFLQNMLNEHFALEKKRFEVEEHIDCGGLFDHPGRD